MRLAIIGLGRMGFAIAERVLDAGHKVVGFDIDVHLCKQLDEVGGTSVTSLAALAEDARIFWLMVPAKLVDQVLQELVPHLKGGDIVIDGGNSKFTDSIARARMLQLKNIFFLDCGTSGGVHGRAIGFSLMVGGDKDSYTKIHSLLAAIAAPNGVGYMGSSGTGHYVKMVHNGIEYALLQAYAQGLHVIKDGSFKKEYLDLAEITRVWSNGSVIRSWILDLLHDIVAKDQSLAHISGEIGELGTGQWTVDEALQHKIPVDLIEKAVEIRSWSRKTGGNFATKLVALLRHAFGGHSIKTK
jgi:6-phosphogluconate dehydrogenase